ARGSVPSSHVTRRSRYAPVADCRSSTPTTVVVAWRVRSATGYATRTRRPIASSARWAISTISGAGLTSRRFTIDLLLGLPCLAAGLLILGPRLGTGAGALARGAPLRGPPLRLAAEEPAVLRGLRAMDVRAVRQVALRQRNHSGVAPRPGGQGARIECGADRGSHSVLQVRGWDLAGVAPRPRITGAADQPPRPSASGNGVGTWGYTRLKYAFTAAFSSSRSGRSGRTRITSGSRPGKAITSPTASVSVHTSTVYGG